MSTFSLVLFLTSLVQFISATSTLHKVMLSKSQVVCNDGSTPVYYQQLTLSSHKWIMMLQGGADCYNDSSCQARWKSTPYLMTGGQSLASEYQVGAILDSDCQMNPAFCQYNKLFVHYCSSDRWVGRTQKQTQKGKFRFEGSNIVEEVVKDVQSRHSKLFTQQIQFILTGSSAGGNGAYSNALRVKALLEKQSTVVDFRLLLDSAHWLDGTLYRPSDCMTDECDIESRFTQAIKNLWNPEFDKQCSPNIRKFKHECLLERQMVSHFKFPVLSVGFMYDLRQVFYDGIHKQSDFNQAEMKYIHSRGREVAYQLQVLSKAPTFSYFYLGCFYHGIIDTPTAYNSVTNRDHFSASQAIKKWLGGEKLQEHSECDSSTLDCAHNCESLNAKQYGNYDKKIKSQAELSDL